jgi:hypothetical protein
MGRPVVCSTFTSAAPCSAQHRRDLLGRPVHLVEVVPNTFTAMSPRTPAISSLKRIWMGWVIS